MTLPDMIRVVRWMVRDTFRQAVASKLVWVVLAVTAVATAVCGSVSVVDAGGPGGGPAGVLTPDEAVRVGLAELRRQGELKAVPADPSAVGGELRAKAEAVGRERAAGDGTAVGGGRLTVGFGAVEVAAARSPEASVRVLQAWLAGAVADTAGVLLALLWTAGFVPAFVDPQAATVLLAKPAPRWLVLAGKYLGVVLFVAAQAAAFVACTWLALGLRAGVWGGGYWLTVPVLAAHFAAFYAVSVFLAVWTRSGVASAFGTLLFWLVCWTVNLLRHRAAADPASAVGATAQLLAEVGYWVLPKPLDFGGLLADLVAAGGVVAPVPEYVAARDGGRLAHGLSAATSAGFAAAALAAAGYELEMTDY